MASGSLPHGLFLFELYDFVVAWNKYFFNFVKNNPDNTSPAEILLDPRLSHKWYMLMRFLYPVLFLTLLGISCSESDEGQNPLNNNGFKEPVPETLTFDQAVVTYYGDDSFSGVSDLWTLELSTSMSTDEAGDPVGPGQRLTVSLNAATNSSATPDVQFLSGTYYMPANSGDLSAGTFNPGYMTEQDRPNGAVQVPTGSFFGDLAAGSAQFEADLLREGNCKVTVNSDGSLSVEGMLVGTDFLKRIFTYRGTPQLVDYSAGKGSEVPNSNLTDDIELTSLSAIRIVDKGDSYVLGDESYRTFEVYLADAGIDLSPSWPSGSGELLRMEFFVPWDTTVEAGIPNGVYSLPEEIPPYGGVYREDIVPFRIIPGYPDKFTNNTGTWYQSLDGGKWVDYARITGGSVTVERPDGQYRITVDLTDCDTPAHHVRAAFSK